MEELEGGRYSKIRLGNPIFKGYFPVQQKKGLIGDTYNIAPHIISNDRSLRWNKGLASATNSDGTYRRRRRRRGPSGDGV